MTEGNVNCVDSSTPLNLSEHQFSKVGGMGLGDRALIQGSIQGGP